MGHPSKAYRQLLLRIFIRGDGEYTVARLGAEIGTDAYHHLYLTLNSMVKDGILEVRREKGGADWFALSGSGRAKAEAEMTGAPMEGKQ